MSDVIAKPAAVSNYDWTRTPVNLIVDHHTASTLEAAIQRFQTVGSKVSAHYIVDRDGSLYQCVDIHATAYHSGDYPTNQRSIGIEHVSLGPNGELDAFTDVQYARSSALHAALATQFGFPLDTNHVWPHSRVIATQCPGTLDLARLMQGEVMASFKDLDDAGLVILHHLIQLATFGAIDYSGQQAFINDVRGGTPINAIYDGWRDSPDGQSWSAKREAVIAGGGTVEVPKGTTFTAIVK